MSKTVGEKTTCRNSIKAFPIANGIASIMSCLYPGIDAKPCFWRFASFSDLCFMNWHGRRSVALWKGICCRTMYISHSVACVIGLLKGKSAIAIARQFRGKQRNFEGENFWTRGYAVSTVEFELWSCVATFVSRKRLSAVATSNR